MPEGSSLSADKIDISGVGPIQGAKDGQITFLVNKAYAKYLEDTAASALIIGKADPQCKIPQIIHQEPYVAFAKTAQLFFKSQYGEPSISERAEIDPTAKLGEGCIVHPRVFVGKKAKVGKNVVMFPGVFVGDGVQIGDDCVLKANVVLEPQTKIGDRVLIHAGAVLGMDGFGFAPGKEGITKIPQIGGVSIGNDVEIGANSTVACGALSDTVIGNGTKLDSHVHVAHGAVIGSHTMLCGMAAIAGSAKLGDRCIVGGGSMVKDSVALTDGVILGGHTAVTKDIREPGVYIGFPAAPQREWQKTMAHTNRLAKLYERVKIIEKSKS